MEQQPAQDEARTQATALTAAAAAHRDGERYDEALAAYGAALAAWQAVGDRGEAATILVTMAQVQHATGRHDEALALLEQARDGYRAAGDPAGEASTFILAGEVHDANHDIEQALASYQAALDLVRAAGDQAGVARTLERMAIVQWVDGDSDTAVDWHHQAATAYLAAGDPGAAAAALVHTAAGQGALGRLDEGVADAQRAAALYRELGDGAGESMALVRGARLLWRLGRRDEAEADMERAAAVLRAAGLAANRAGDTVSALEQRRAQMRAGLFPEATRGTLLPADEVEALIQNTVAVMTTAPVLRDAWQQKMTRARADAEARGGAWRIEVDLFDAVLAILAGRRHSLPADHPYGPTLAAIATGIAGGGPKDLPVAREIMEAVREFVATADWDAAQRLVEERREVLLQPEVDDLFERNIGAAVANGDDHSARVLAIHRDVLRACRADGIDAGFAWLRRVLAEADARAQAAQGRDALPPDFVDRCVAGFVGSPEDRVALFAYLQGLAAFDPDLAELTAELQAALLAGDLAGHGQRLTGGQAEVWQRIKTQVSRGDRRAPG